ncbi:SDR family oxidoreductase [bacterium]|nr:SDR family oxidoreductase [bacterium]
MRLKDKVALITGGGRGIERAIALGLSREGADVAVSARNRAEIDRMAGEVRAAGRRAIAVPADVSRADQVRRMVDRTLAEFGQIDILVNNAGYARHFPVAELTEEVWDTTMDVNLKGVFLCTQAALPGMVARRSGCILTVASISGHRGYRGCSAYCAAKAGAITFMETLALEVREHQIKVHTISPGAVATRMRADNHPGEDPSTILQDEEIANVAVFLATLPPQSQVREVTIVPTLQLADGRR